ncbi:hypothetical protein CR513_19457, partial [Mucuna pruriens]
MAEYEACALGIMMAIEHQVKTLEVFDDSMLVIYQLRGEWEMRDAKLIPYHYYVMEMSEHLDKITFHYILRDENQMANTLATLSTMPLVNKEQELTIQVQHQAKIAHFQQVNQDDTEVDGKPWYHDIDESYFIHLIGTTNPDDRGPSRESCSRRAVPARPTPS